MRNLGDGIEQCGNGCPRDEREKSEAVEAANCVIGRERDSGRGGAVGLEVLIELLCERGRGGGGEEV